MSSFFLIIAVLEKEFGIFGRIIGRIVPRTVDADVFASEMHLPPLRGPNTYTRVSAPQRGRLILLIYMRKNNKRLTE